MVACGIPWNTHGITGEDSFTPFIEKLKAIRKIDFANIVDSVPEEWNANRQDLEKLIEVLANIDVNQIITVLREIHRTNNRFPNWR